MTETPIKKNREPGLYILNERISNVERFDKRFRRDWRKREFIEPGEYLVEEVRTTLSPDSDEPVLAIRSIRESIGNRLYRHWNVDLFEAILSASIPAPMTPTRVLRMKDELLLQNSTLILEKLFDAGRFTLEDVGKAADRVLEEWDAEES